MDHHQTSHSITSLPPSPEAERRARMLKYSLAMATRLACVIVLFFVRGWWLILPAFGAIFLPYFAVIVANATRSGPRPDVERPGLVVPSEREDDGNDGNDGTDGTDGTDGPDGTDGGGAR